MASAELVFVLQRPRGRFANVVSSLGELWSGELPPMSTVDACYDGTRDRVLICAHYDARSLTEGVRTRIQIIARDAGVVVLDGATLDDADRKTLLDDDGHKVEGQPALAIALWNLSRLMGGEEVWAGEPEPAPVPTKARAITASGLAERGGVYSLRPNRPVGLVPPPVTSAKRTHQGLPPARGVAKPAPSRTITGLGKEPPAPARIATGTDSPTRTRSGLPPVAQARTAAGTGAPKTAPVSRDADEARLATGSSPRVSTRRDVVAPHAIGSRFPGRAAEDGTSPRIDLTPERTLPPTDGDRDPETTRRPSRVTQTRYGKQPPVSAMPAPALVAPGPIDRIAAPTMPVPARTETEDLDRIDSGPVTVADPIARAITSTGTEPYMPSLAQRADGSSIDVRYLRSGRWAPARLRALSLKGAYLITAAFPRVGDSMHIALGLGELGALVRGSVFHVTTPADVAQTGTSGFAVRFDLDDAARTQLSALLHKARANGVTITPPPPRGAVRLPVQWPMKLGTPRGPIKGDALDVSRGGMFINAVRALDVDQPVSFSAVLDDGSAPVSGRARVVREINETDAQRRGLRPGFGLAIQEMGDTDAERWNGFLARVQRRSEHRILVGASPSRLPELTAGLSGAGYAVVGGTDAGSLVQLSDAEARPPDVAVIDATLFEGQEPNWLESLFSARKVPCVTLRGDARRARVVVDKLLAV